MGRDAAMARHKKQYYTLRQAIRWILTLGRVELSDVEKMEGARLPRWYGYAYSLPDRAYEVWYPCPLNVIVRWIGETWFKLRYRRSLSYRYAVCRYWFLRGIQFAENSREVERNLKLKGPKTHKAFLRLKWEFETIAEILEGNRW